MNDLNKASVLLNSQCDLIYVSVIINVSLVDRLVHSTRVVQKVNSPFLVISRPFGRHDKCNSCAKRSSPSILINYQM